MPKATKKSKLRAKRSKKTCKSCSNQRLPDSKYCLDCDAAGGSVKNAKEAKVDFDKVVAEFKKSSSLPKVSTADATAEANAGFKGGSKPSSGKLLKPLNKVDEKEPNIGSIVLYPYGVEFVNGHVEPRTKKLPSPKQQQKLLDSGLGVLGKFYLSATASHGDVDSFLRAHIPMPFKYLDAKYGTDECHYYLCAKDYREMFICGRDDGITGELIDRWKASSGRSYKDKYIRLITKYPIPSTVYQDWDKAIAQVVAGDEDSSSKTDNEDSSHSSSDAGSSKPLPLRSPKDRMAKAKGKAKASDGNTSDEDGSSGDGNESSYFGDEVRAPFTQHRHASFDTNASAALSDPELDKDLLAAIFASRNDTNISAAGSSSASAGPSTASTSTISTSAGSSRAAIGGKRKRTTGHIIDLATSSSDEDHPPKRAKVSPRPTRLAVKQPDPPSSPAQGFGRPSAPTNSIWAD